MKLDRHGYHHLTDGDRFQLNIKDKDLLLACCKCGLVHRLCFRVSGETLFIKLARDEAETKRLKPKKRRT